MPLLKSPYMRSAEKCVDKRNLGSTLETNKGRIFAGYADRQAVKSKL